MDKDTSTYRGTGLGDGRKMNILTLFDQNGPFATGDEPLGLRPFSVRARQRAQKFRESGVTTRYRVMRNQVFDLLDVRSMAQIHELLKDPAERRRVNERAYRLIGNMFGIEGSPGEIVSRVTQHARTADAVIDYLRDRVFAKYASHVEITNEVEATDSPVDLLLVMFDDRYHKKARFEAKRKLLLMNLAGSIDQREREMDIENRFADFLSFLNRHVWSADLRIGELEEVYLLSAHDPDTFACTDVKVVPPEDAAGIEKRPGRKITLIKRRRFRVNGKDIPIYVAIRKKTPEAKVLKLLRKGEENPAVAVEDELGLMGVVDSMLDVHTFQKHLTQSAIRAGSFMTLEEVSDTLSGGTHVRKTPGSSPRTAMYKFFARMGGMRVEFIVHTNRTYLNYRFQREISHEEYEVRRIFDSGVGQLLFPPEIYHLDMQSSREELIAWIRKKIEEF